MTRGTAVFYSPMSQRCFVKTPQNSTLLSEWSLMAAKMIPTSKQNLLSILNSIPPDTSLNNSKPRCEFHSILSVMMNISHYSLKKLKQTKFYLTYNLSPFYKFCSNYSKNGCFGYSVQAK